MTAGAHSPELKALFGIFIFHHLSSCFLLPSSVTFFLLPFAFQTLSVLLIDVIACAKALTRLHFG